VPSLSLETRGEGSTLVMAHGFTQTGRAWGPFADRLAAHHRLALVDLPGHGDSSALALDLVEGGALLAQAAGTDSFDLLGYSLGARFALHAALHAPHQVGRLVLIGVTAGIEDADERAQRRRRDDALADGLEQDGDVEGFLRRWLSAPMFATLGPAGAFLEERQRNTAAGLASSLRLAGTGTQTPVWDRLAELTMPVLAMAGATDDRFCALGARLARTVPAGVFAEVPGAGHAAHLEQPGLSAAIVSHWLATTPPRAD
jgi:2-succinyl-6-hydroxy-2,4-cyclohexadiene-1-carboxylate synthase